MSRSATVWAYGNEALGFGLSASELAVLRAICWSINPTLGRTKPMGTDELSRLTGISSPSTISAVRNRLRNLGIIAYERANKLPKKPDENPSPFTENTRRKTICVYTLNRKYL